MRPGSPGKTGTFLRCLFLFTASTNFPAATGAGDIARLQQLLYGEALFHSHQQDYLSAISRLQLAQAQGLLSPSSEDTRLLMARLKLAYGLHLEAGFDLHALLGRDVPPPVRNRAWYELARAFSHKGYQQAAVEALDNIQGELPAEIAGDYQLLNATVLMALDRNREAADALTQWNGAPELAAYAHYNRGIALVRAGDYQHVVPTLEMAVKMPAKEEELLALRDKARLALGYAYAREGNDKRARKQLEAVRPQGPYSNRALLALGWIDYKQGRSASALASWMELRGRSPTDPAVLETLLVVPAVQRELDALQIATRDYETAVAAYNMELEQLHDARDSVQEGVAVEQLLHPAELPLHSAASTTRLEATRFLGPLLASRNFVEMQRGHGELHKMLEEVDRSLREIDALSGTRNTAGQAVQPSGLPAYQPLKTPESTTARDQPSPGTAGTTRSQSEWIQRERKLSEHPGPGIPQLPEIDSPSQRTLKPFPERELPSPPPVSNYIRQPPSAEITGLPDSEILWLPDSGEFYQQPKSGEFFRRPGEAEIEDYAYPDRVPKKRATRGEAYAYQLNRLLPADEQVTGFEAAAVPVGEALRELATALNSATRRIAELDGAYTSDAGIEQRVAALRGRIITLRTRIANAIALYESYTRSLALDELDRRQHLLEDLLEQASLELAKTYDRNSER